MLRVTLLAALAPLFLGTPVLSCGRRTTFPARWASFTPHNTSRALLGRVWVGAFAGVAGAGPEAEEGLEFAEDGVEGHP
jgi:hypothetical protein